MRKRKTLSRDYAMTLILAILSEGPRHGYDIAREVERKSGNRIRFNDGTLYPVLHALEEEDCIESSIDPTSGDRPRRIYTIKEFGLAELEKHIDDWNDFTSAINEILSGRQTTFSLNFGWGNGRR